MKKDTVLVTGGTGFVGSYIIRYLVQKGYQVKAIKRKTSSMQLVQSVNDKVEWLEGDILDLPFVENCLQQVDWVIHAAAMISFHPKEVDTMMKVNAEGTANIVNASLHVGIKKLVHLSSIAALGRKEFQKHIDESVNWENSKMNSNYAISKFKAECEVWRGIQEGLNAVIINPSVIIGAGFWDSGSCKLFAKMWNGLNFYPQGATGFVDVRDVAQISIALMESTVQAERFILNGANLSYQSFFHQIAVAMGKNPPQKEANPIVLAILYRLDWLLMKLFNKHPLLTKETIRTTKEQFEYSNKKIVQQLNYQFVPFSTSVEDTAKEFVRNKTKGEPYGTLAL